MRPLWTLFIASACLLGCRQDSPVLFERDGITVRLREIHNPERDYSTFQTEVRRGAETACWSSGPFGQSGREARRELGAVLYEDGYLFVPASCGGGNASKCQGYQAFSTKAGLRWLGNLTGRWDGQRARPYEGGVFYDTGDMLEINDLLNHAESPRYALAYTDDGQRLRFDPARSWTLNAEAFQAAGDDPPGLLYRAGLAKLCGRPVELRAAQAAAAQVLNAKAQRLFRSSLEQVHPGDVRPNPFIPVGACPPAEQP